jgi:hypothetical protein
MYHSGWGDFSAFTTEAACDKMPMNLTTSSNGANTAVIMSWDTPESGAPDHYFLEMTNVTTGAVYEWNDIPGTDYSQDQVQPKLRRRDFLENKRSLWYKRNLLGNHLLTACDIHIRW